MNQNANLRIRYQGTSGNHLVIYNLDFLDSGTLLELGTISFGLIWNRIRGNRLWTSNIDLLFCRKGHPSLTKCARVEAWDGLVLWSRLLNDRLRASLCSKAAKYVIKRGLLLRGSRLRWTVEEATTCVNGWLLSRWTSIEHVVEKVSARLRWRI